MSASVHATAYARAPADARVNGLPLMELENETAIRRPPPQEHPAQREANPSAWPDAWLINAVWRDPPDEDALNTSPFPLPSVQFSPARRIGN